MAQVGCNEFKSIYSRSQRKLPEWFDWLGCVYSLKFQYAHHKLIKCERALKGQSPKFFFGTSFPKLLVRAKFFQTSRPSQVLTNFSSEPSSSKFLVQAKFFSTSSPSKVLPNFLSETSPSNISSNPSSPPTSHPSQVLPNFSSKPSSSQLLVLAKYNFQTSLPSQVLINFSSKPSSSQHSS